MRKQKWLREGLSLETHTFDHPCPLLAGGDFAKAVTTYERCVDLLGEYIEGTLPADRAKALEEHLSLCPPCITFVRTYKATRRMCRSVLAREMPEELAYSLKSFLGKHVPGFACSKSDTDAAPSHGEPDTLPKKV